jgi:hypothetical protein
VSPDQESSPFGELDYDQARESIENPAKYLQSLASELSQRSEFEGKHLETTYVALNCGDEPPPEEQQSSGDTPYE